MRVRNTAYALVPFHLRPLDRLGGRDLGFRFEDVAYLWEF